MVLFFSIFILIVKTVFALLQDKCIFYKDVEEFPAETCVEKTNTAICYQVTNIKKDLRGLPSDLQNLCIQMERATVSSYTALDPGSFSNFVSLEYLDITGCFSEISPEAFTGLVNVTSLNLSFWPDGCCKVAIDFSGFPSLTSLFLSHYSLSLMANNVFDTIPQLKDLEIAKCLKDLSEVLCRLANVKSLKKFLLYLELYSLNFPNCSLFNPSHEYISTVYNIEMVILILESVQHIDQGALEVLGNLFSLEFGLKEDLLQELSLIGVNKIHNLSFKVDVLNIDELCSAAKLYSIESISVHYRTINCPPTTTTISEGIQCQYLSICEEIKEIFLVYESEFAGTLILLDVHLIFQIFSNLSLIDISSHALRPTDFQSLCLSFPQSVKQLSFMYLNSNHMGKVISHQFMCFTNLETLELVASNISIIQKFSFIGLIKLTHLNLSKNKISYIYQNTFSGLYGLTALDLQENPIIQIETNSFGHFINLCTLLLGDLNFPPHKSLIKLNLSDIFGRIPYNLSHMIISSGLRPMQLVIGSNTTLNKSLDFTIKGQYVTIEDCSRPFFTSIVTLQ
ncbi:toll-like receptor 13 [Xyrauchen texanus]|uniref:toll-like receptor 13 n=1 Tax=Xyrauchen texanus TaxID=154827 RepID=UPI002242B7BF|nr:toll-like receptor 13 [Xyrauchen texanus]